MSVRCRIAPQLQWPMDRIIIDDVLGAELCIPGYRIAFYGKYYQLAVALLDTILTGEYPFLGDEPSLRITVPKEFCFAGGFAHDDAVASLLGFHAVFHYKLKDDIIGDTIPSAEIERIVPGNMHISPPPSVMGKTHQSVLSIKERPCIRKNVCAPRVLSPIHVYLLLHMGATLPFTNVRARHPQVCELVRKELEFRQIDRIDSGELPRETKIFSRYPNIRRSRE